MAGTGEHRTEVDGWSAEWQVDHDRIRITLVHGGSETP